MWVDVFSATETSGCFACSRAIDGITNSIASASVVVIFTSPASRRSTPCVSRTSSVRVLLHRLGGA